MKKVITVLLSMALLLMAVPGGSVAAATTGTYNGIEYKIDGGEVTLTGYTSALPNALTIPSTIEGYPVTTIGYSAFEDADNLTSVVIPDSVTFIDDYAFAWCFYLRTVDVGHGVERIDYGAFGYCSKLTTITIGRGASNINDNAFTTNRNLTAINVDAANPYYCSVDGVLFSKDKTRLVKYPGGRTGGYAIPEGVTALGTDSFDFCDTITSVHIPSTLSRINANYFNTCDGLTDYTVAEGNPTFSAASGLLLSKDKTQLISCPAGKRGAFTIPDGVTTIKINAFENCENLTSITIAPSVTTIEDSAFSYCHGLTSVTIPDTVTTIGNYLFYDCNNLATATVGKGITRLSQMTFYDCHNLTTIHLPDTLTYIGFKAIWNTGYYRNSANWTGEVLYLDDYLIDSTSKISGDYVVPAGTKLIAEYAFHGRSKLTSITIPEGVPAIEFSTFYECSNLTSITLPRSLTFVGEWAFAYCNQLKDVYYGGTAADISNIRFSANNAPLTNALWHVVATVTLGDVNSDGKVNNRDLGVLQQYLNEWAVTIDVNAADLYDDDKINNRDLGLLQRLLNE